MYSFFKQSLCQVFDIQCYTTHRFVFFKELFEKEFAWVSVTTRQ